MITTGETLQSWVTTCVKVRLLFLAISYNGSSKCSPLVNGCAGKWLLKSHVVTKVGPLLFLLNFTFRSPEKI